MELKSLSWKEASFFGCADLKSSEINEVITNLCENLEILNWKKI